MALLDKAFALIVGIFAGIGILVTFTRLIRSATDRWNARQTLKKTIKKLRIEISEVLDQADQLEIELKAVIEIRDAAVESIVNLRESLAFMIIEDKGRREAKRGEPPVHHGSCHCVTCEAEHTMAITCGWVRDQLPSLIPKPKLHPFSATFTRDAILGKEDKGLMMAESAMFGDRVFLHSDGLLYRINKAPTPDICKAHPGEGKL